MHSKNTVLVLLGAVIGGGLGHFAFLWIARQGFYGLILPGALVGFGAGVFRGSSKWVPVLCGLLALALGIFSEWRFAAFVVDSTLGYFLSHLHQLRPITLIMIVVGAAIAFWIPFRRIRSTASAQQSE